MKKTVKKKAAKKAVKKAAKKKAAMKTKAKKKPALNKKEPAKKAVKKDPQELFAKWWEKVACKKVEKMEKAWLKENEANDPNEDGGGDHWCVNEMMHNGDAFEMTYEIAERVFMMGHNKEKWEFNMGDSLFCDLDEVISEAYEAGKNSK